MHSFVFRVASLRIGNGTYCFGYVVRFMNAAVEDEGMEKGFSDIEYYFVSILYAIHSNSPQNFTQDDVRFHFVRGIGGGSDMTAITFGAVLLGTP